MSIAKITDAIPQDVDVAIKAMIALNFLDADSIPASTGSRRATLRDATSVAEQAKLFTAHVVCH